MIEELRVSPCTLTLRLDFHDFRNTRVKELILWGALVLCPAASVAVQGISHDPLVSDAYFTLLDMSEASSAGSRWLKSYLAVFGWSWLTRSPCGRLSIVSRFRCPTVCRCICMFCMFYICIVNVCLSLIVLIL